MTRGLGRVHWHLPVSCQPDHTNAKISIKNIHCSDEEDGRLCGSAYLRVGRTPIAARLDICMSSIDSRQMCSSSDDRRNAFDMLRVKRERGSGSSSSRINVQHHRVGASCLSRYCVLDLKSCREGLFCTRTNYCEQHGDN